MKGAVLFVLWCLLSAQACGEPKPKPTPPPVDDACAAAEANMLSFDPPCEGAMGSPGPDRVYGNTDDRSYAAECRLLEHDFPGLAQPACVASAGSCEAAKACSDAP